MSKVSDTGKTYSVHYIVAVAIVTVTVALLSWWYDNIGLAQAAAILGLYALHLMSVRFILDGQRQQQAALQDQWTLLNSLISRMGMQDESVDALAEAMSVAGDDGIKAGGQPNAEVDSFAPPVPGATPNGAGFDPDGTWPASPLQMAMLEGNDPPPPEPAPEPAPEPEEPPAPIPVPRHFALGTVALVRNVLTPSEVARVLLEQRRRPDSRFGTLAVELGLLSETALEELLLAQQEGLFTDEEMRDARLRLQEFRQSTAAAMADVD